MIEIDGSWYKIGKDGRIYRYSDVMGWVRSQKTHKEYQKAVRRRLRNEQ